MKELFTCSLDLERKRFVDQKVKQMKARYLHVYKSSLVVTKMDICMHLSCKLKMYLGFQTDSRHICLPLIPHKCLHISLRFERILLMYL